ncbi:piggyBac transposable element-derived protein 3-like [Homalodisca vitripennis]|uniref:piggyBac transposable element-derived protein 3-like n=1 Tax=Homalodisca vitripennis TaxID=197043 RepID=UPI001EEB76B1|nr:piggyBac transposable element-derived protein 3-like [Homalodisca vitripennis]
MKDDVWNKGIAEAMPRNKFLNIMRCLHVCNNNDLDPNTKFAKVSPLWKMLNKRWLKYFAGDVNLSVDESMIPYYGRHSTKQHIHGKPIRFGYKAWCLCTRSGYLVQGNLYEGANTGNKYPEVGVGASVVLNLCEKLPQRPDGYNLYFDNFFTSVVLLEKLAEEGHNAAGTIRANRVEKAPLSDVKSVSKMPRGSFDQITEKDSNVTLVRYNDNNVITVASTACGVEPVGKVRRWSAAEKKHTSVNQPSCVVMYNQYMGGVDRLDENVSKL